MIRGRFDPVSKATLCTALEPLARRTSRDDDRPRQQRLAQGLVELATHNLNSGRLTRRSGERTHLNVTTTLETLLGRVGSPAAELEFSLPISGKTVERLACDCAVTRVLLGSDSAVIDVGRAQRVVSRATRRALNDRDRHCQWPQGCERKATWCEPHQLVPWARGGSSDLAGSTLLCPHHHWQVHEGGWQLVRTDDRRLLIIPPLAFPTSPHGPLLPSAA